MKIHSPTGCPLLFWGGAWELHKISHRQVEGPIKYVPRLRRFDASFSLDFTTSSCMCRTFLATAILGQIEKSWRAYTHVYIYYTYYIYIYDYMYKCMYSTHAHIHTYIYRYIDIYIYIHIPQKLWPLTLRMPPVSWMAWRIPMGAGRTKVQRIARGVTGPCDCEAPVGFWPTMGWWWSLLVNDT